MKCCWRCAPQEMGAPGKRRDRASARAPSAERRCHPAPASTEHGAHLHTSLAHAYATPQEEILKWRIQRKKALRLAIGVLTEKLGEI